MRSITASPPWYRPIRGLAMAITVLLGAQIALLVARALAYMARIRLLHRISGGEVVSRAQVQLADSRVAGAGGFWLLVFIATGVVWLVWQHRAQANAQHLTTKKLTFSPGWAVGWWFIPLANLVQPFLAVRELWQASGGTGSLEEGTWPVLVLWWIAWLGFDLVSVFARVAFERATDASALTTADEGNLIAMVLGIASAAFAIAIVRAVVRRQESGIGAWAEAAAQIPPPPPPPPPGPPPE
jgi:hypothetical protein